MPAAALLPSAGGKGELLGTPPECQAGMLHHYKQQQNANFKGPQAKLQKKGKATRQLAVVFGFFQSPATV